MADSVARIRIMAKADRPKRRGWFRVGLVYRDSPDKTQPIAQFRYKGDAWAYAQTVRVDEADEVLIW